MAELGAGGHEAIPAPPSTEIDLATSPDLAPLIRATEPDAVAHLAAVTFVPDATNDPDLARRVTVGGTSALFAGLDEAGSTAAVLISSSADVYGAPSELPIRETAAIRPVNEYGRTKVAQERVAVEAAARRTIVIARAFNHVGPGQRPVFVAPKLARDVVRLRSNTLDSIPIGDVSVRRDFIDVRDVVVAYRELLEAAAAGRMKERSATFNVGSRHSISIGELLTRLCQLADVEPRWHVDPSQLRPDVIRDRYADTSALRTLTGWEPRIELDDSLRDLLASTSG